MERRIIRKVRMIKTRRTRMLRRKKRKTAQFSDHQFNIQYSIFNKFISV